LKTKVKKIIINYYNNDGGDVIDNDKINGVNGDGDVVVVTMELICW